VFRLKLRWDCPILGRTPIQWRTFDRRSCDWQPGTKFPVHSNRSASVSLRCTPAGRQIAEFESSGLEQSEFCRKEGLALSTLRRQLRKRQLGTWEATHGNRLARVELARKLNGFLSIDQGRLKFTEYDPSLGRETAIGTERVACSATSAARCGYFGVSVR
jgi:hypothetical protein